MAQGGERLLCHQEVASAILAGSTYVRAIQHPRATGRSGPGYRRGAQVTR